MKNGYVALLAIALTVCGCKHAVLDVVDPDPQNSAANQAESAPTGEVFSLALRGADAPAADSAVSDPEALVLVFSSAPLTCEDPAVRREGCAGPYQWRQRLVIPSELDRPGVIDLMDPRVSWAFAIDSEADSELGCPASEGTAYWGTLEIVGSDATSLSVKLRGFQSPSNLAFDGDYVVERCGAAPP